MHSPSRALIVMQELDGGLAIPVLLEQSNHEIILIIAVLFV